MPAHQANAEIDGKVQDEQPGKEEMPSAARGEVAVAGYRQPGGEGSTDEFAILDGDAEHASRRKAPGTDPTHSMKGISITVCPDRDEGEVVVGTRNAPNRGADGR